MDDCSSDHTRIGELLVHDRLITDEQLGDALAAQAHSPVYTPLGRILTDLGYLSRQQLRQALTRYRKQIPLGELLLKLGVISQEQLDEALGIQKRTAKRLGLILMERGFIKKSGLADAICLQLGIPCTNVAECHADQSLLEKVNAAFLTKRRVMPLGYDKKTNTVTLLMEDPTDQEAVADLEKIFRATIEPIMLRDGWIEAVLASALDVWG